MSRTGVLLMTYGSPRDLDDVAAYLARVRGGRAPSEELVREFRRRYEIVGGSPLVPITERQAAALERALNERSAEDVFLAQAAMRFSAPTIADAVAAAAARGVQNLLGLILSPQYSPILMGGYAEQLEAAAAGAGLQARMIESWHLEPDFVHVLADSVLAGLARFPTEVRDHVPVLMTAHSLPRRVVDREPGYVDQLKETARAVADAAGLPPGRRLFAYQSAGHTPEEWLKPDLLDLLPELAAAGHRHVLLAPVQFLADHLETLYDIDIAGRAQAEQAGFVQFTRVPAPNDAPDLARALADVVLREVRAQPTSGVVAPGAPLPRMAERLDAAAAPAPIFATQQPTA